jgi:hypothetical protein
MEDQGFDFARFWMEGGVAMYLVALLWLAAEGAGVLAIVTRKSVVAMAAMALSALPLTAGVLGMVYNRSVVENAVAMVNPADRAIILEQGNKEAMRPLQLGGVLTLFTFPLGILAFVRAPRQKSSDVKSISNAL